MSRAITVLMNHSAYPAKYRRVIFDKHVEAALKVNCLGVVKRIKWSF